MNIIVTVAKVTLYQPLFNALIFLAWLVPGHNVGWAIVLLTLVVRALLYPLNASMIRSQQALSALQPEIDRIKKDFKDDQQAQSKAMLELYQAKKINPFGSCILLAIQLPILWILYRVFTVGLDTSHFALLYSFVPHPASLGTVFLGIDLIKPSLIIGVLAGVAQFFQSRQLMAAQPTPSNDSKDAASQTQAMIAKQSMYLFPALTIFISARFPAALALYWLTTTLAMVAQQWYMKRNKPSDAAVTVSVRSGKSKKK